MTIDYSSDSEQSIETFRTLLHRGSETSGVMQGRNIMKRFEVRGLTLYDTHNHAAAVVQGNSIYDGDNQIVATIRGNDLYDSEERKMITLRGMDILDANNNKVASLADAEQWIKGEEPGILLVSLWYCFVR